MISRRSFVAGTLCATSILAASRARAAESLDVAYVNATVWDGISDAPHAGAIGVSADRIAAVGTDEVHARITSKTQVIDLHGAFVMPGMTDCHTHFSLASLGLSQINLRNAHTPQQFSAQIGQAAHAARPGRWVLGDGWDADQWGGQLPDKSWIDPLTGDVPVAVTRYDLHMMLLNSAALRRAGIDRNTPDVPGGVIVRDAQGNPTGLIKDGATILAKRAIPLPTDQDVDEAVRRGIALGLSKGLTKVHTPELDWMTHDSLRRLRAHGETDLRFYSFVPLKDWERLVQLIQQEGTGDDWVRWGGVKALADGSLGSRTALFTAPYDDDRTTRGIHVTSPADLREWIGQADRHGLQVATHAIGDAATHEVFDIYAEIIKKNGQRDRRFRMEHAQHLLLKDVPRFRELNVIASIQPYHAIDDGRWAIRRLGAARLKGSFAYRTMVDAGAHVCCGSDWPVAPLDPLTGIQAAVLRQTLDGKNPGGWLPDQKLTLRQALNGYVREAAYAAFADDRMGTLAPGYLADFIVMDQNLFTLDPARITQAKVLRTVVGGRPRFVA